MEWLENTKKVTGILALLMTGLFIAVTAVSSFTAYHPDPTLNQTLIALTTLTWGFYFGSSTGSKAKDDKPLPVVEAIAPVVDERKF